MTAFEEHYFGCDECLAEVQMAQAIHLGAESGAIVVPSKPSKVVTMPVRPATRGSGRRLHWGYLVAAAAGVMVMSVAGYQMFSGKGSAPESVHSQAPAAVPVQVPAAANPVEVQPAVPEPSLVASNQDLGAIRPMAYRASALRGVADDAADRFQKAMAWYLKQDYRQAAAGLAVIPVGVPGGGKPEDHITDAGIQMYLGVSQLMLNQNSEAIRSLRRAAAYGDTPYLENASFYLAKGLIRQKQIALASAELRHVAELRGDRQDEARQLLARLNEAQTR